MNRTLIAPPRKVRAARSDHAREGDVLRGKIGAWVILDIEPWDQTTKDGVHFTRRFTVGRIAVADIPAGTRVISWVWIKRAKRRQC